jgi:hypothetical protein
MLAVLVLLMVVKVGTDQPVILRGTFGELWARANWFLPGIIVVAAMQFGLTAVQGFARAVICVFWQTSPSPLNVKKLVYFVFVFGFGFASLRLRLTLAIRTFALRKSYRRLTALSVPRQGG